MAMQTFIIFSTLAAAIAAILAAGFALWQAPRQRAHWAFALSMAAVALVVIARLMTALNAPPPTKLFWMRTVLFVEGFWPLCWFLFSLSYARVRAPELSGRVKFAVALMALLPLAIGLPNWETLLVLPLDSYEPGRYLALGPWGRIFVGLALVGLIPPLVNLEATLRASAGLGRWHIKFMILGVGLLLGFEIYLHSYRFLFSTLDLLMAGPQAVVVLLASGLIALSLARSQKGTVALSVSQSALFSSIVLLLVGGYLVAAGGLAKIWLLVGGDAADLWQGLLILVALTGLAGLMLSSRIKAQIKQTLARHFYPHRYDYRQEWLHLTERMSRQLGPDASLRVVVERLSEVLGAPRVSAWLFDDAGRELHLAATTQVSSSQEAAWRDQPIVAPSLAATLLSWEGPSLVESPPTDTAGQPLSGLQALTHATTARLVAPLVIGDRTLGLLAIGPSVTGRAYGREELLLAGTIARQSAAAVLTARLTQEVMRAREMELSQLYSTFLIHDLKNLGATLSLVAQNLPLRYTDERFRDDARRVMHETIEKIQEMTEKVAALRHDYELALESTDLNQLAEESLRALNGSPAGSMISSVTFEPEPVPPIKLDRRQLRSVLTNLLLNAQQATRQSTGRIQLRTEHRDGWASLSVIDDGCGMTQEFIDQHLFQPFRSTKPGGLGIGLYQSRKIIEAHGGRVTVHSHAGKGTTITISLPTHAG